MSHFGPPHETNKLSQRGKKKKFVHRKTEEGKSNKHTEIYLLAIQVEPYAN